MSEASQPLLSGEAARPTQNNRGSEEYRAIKGSLEAALNLEDDANPGIVGVFGDQA
jgi:hypothetical protein